MESYKGTIEVVSGLKPKNGNDFPVAQTHHILAGDNDTRLDSVLDSFEDSLNSFGSSVQEAMSNIDSVSDEVQSVKSSLVSTEFKVSNHKLHISVSRLET